MAAPVRLQRYLASAGVSARRKAEDLITAGRVTVNGKVVTTLGTKIDPDNDSVEVDGEAVVALDKFYVLFNKPKGCITAVSDDRGRPVVMDYLPNVPVPVKPVGRLDFYTEGVLLLTNDGELAAKLLAPASHVPKTYHVKVHGQLSQDDIRALRDGIQLDDGTVTLPAEIEVLPGESKHTWLAITIHEGKHRQIHRMIEALGYFVDKLQRVAFANLTFHGLRVGDARELKQQELNELRDLVDLDHSAVARGRWTAKRESTDIPRRARAKARTEAEEAALLSGREGDEDFDERMDGAGEGDADEFGWQDQAGDDSDRGDGGRRRAGSGRGEYGIGGFEQAQFDERRPRGRADRDDERGAGRGGGRSGGGRSAGGDRPGFGRSAGGDRPGFGRSGGGRSAGGDRPGFGRSAGGDRPGFGRSGGGRSAGGDRPGGGRSAGGDRPGGGRSGGGRGDYGIGRFEQDQFAERRPRGRSDRDDERGGASPNFGRSAGGRAGGERPNFGRSAGGRAGGERPNFGRSAGGRAGGERPSFGRTGGGRGEYGIGDFEKDQFGEGRPRGRTDRDDARGGGGRDARGGGGRDARGGGGRDARGGGGRDARGGGGRDARSGGRDAGGGSRGFGPRKPGGESRGPSAIGRGPSRGPSTGARGPSRGPSAGARPSSAGRSSGGARTGAGSKRGGQGRSFGKRGGSSR